MSRGLLGGLLCWSACLADPKGGDAWRPAEAGDGEGSEAATQPVDTSGSGAPMDASTGALEGGADTGASSEGAEATSGEAGSSESESSTGTSGTTSSGTASTTTTTTGSSTTGPVGDPDVHDNAYCQPIIAWDEMHAMLEEEVVVIMNEKRAEGADCDTRGVFDPAGPLAMDKHIRCAGRVHSKDMADRDYFMHDTPDGVEPQHRAAMAEFPRPYNGENISGMGASAREVVERWMNSDGHCANIMNPTSTLVGIGWYCCGGTWGSYVTAVFGR